MKRLRSQENAVNDGADNTIAAYTNPSSHPTQLSQVVGPNANQVPQEVNGTQPAQVRPFSIVCSFLISTLSGAS